MYVHEVRGPGLTIFPIFSEQLYNFFKELSLLNFPQDLFLVTTPFLD